MNYSMPMTGAVHWTLIVSTNLQKRLITWCDFADRRSPDTYHEALYSSPARPGVYSPTAHVNSRPMPMGTAYRMMENGQQDRGDMVGPSSAKQARSQAPTSSVYEVNYEISVWR